MPTRILVIDDDADDVERVDRALVEHGYVALLARNGEDAVRLAAWQQPALVLLDIRMPGMDGYEVAATIRKLPGLEQTRIVAVTGSVDERDRLMAAGFDGVLEKPIDPESFVSQIRSFLVD